MYLQRIFQDIHKKPPADLMDRLTNLDARRHQVCISSRAAIHPLEMLSDANDIVTYDDDYDYNEMDDSNSYDDDYDDDDDINDDFGEDDGCDDSRGSEDDGCDDSRGREDDDISSNHENDGSDNNGPYVSDN